MAGMPRMADGTLGIGLIGCGRVAGFHAEAIAAIPEARLVGVYDSVPARAAEFAARAGTRAYASYAELLADPAVAAVAVCTPSGLHPSHGIQAAQAGKHVISEKPLGISLEAIDELIRACDQGGVQLFCVKQNRLNPTMRLLRKAVDGGRFGKIYFAQCNVFWNRPQAYYEDAKWRGTWEFDGGAFLNQASHYVDGLYWLFGQPESVLAETATLARKIECEDTGSAIIRFRNGVLANINVTMLTYPKNLEGSITVLGETGTVKVGGIALNHIEKWEFADYTDDDKLVYGSNYLPPNVYGFGHKGYYLNVVKALKGETEPDTDGRSGRKSVELVLAIYKSAREGRRVPLPLQ